MADLPYPRRFAKERRRVYTDVAVVEDESGFGLYLDGRPVRTPGRRLLQAPTRVLAEAVAEEWRAQTDTIVPGTMGLTSLVYTALDWIAPQRWAICEALVGYLETELLCYRADASEPLAREQAAVWQPVLDDLAARDGLALRVTEGVMPIAQPPEAFEALREILDNADVWDLTGLQALALPLGSLALALAVWRERLTAQKAFELAFLDELSQEVRWGTDAEAAARRADIEKDVLAAGRFLDLMRDRQVPPE